MQTPIRPSSCAAYALIGLTALLGATATSHALMQVGEGKIDLLVSTSLTWDSRINARADAADDFIARADIGFTYFRPSRVMDISATLGIRADRYFDFSEFNDENVYFDFSVSPGGEVRTSRFTFSGDIVLDSRTESNADVGEIVTTRTYGARGTMIYDPNSRYTVTANAGYQYRDADRKFSDQETYDIGAFVAVPYSRVLSLLGGISFAHNITDTDLENEKSDTLTYYIGVSGQLTPKLEGTVQAGAESRSFETGGNNTIPYLSASLNWRVDETTALNLSARNSTGTALNGIATESLSVQLGANRTLTQRMRANAGIGYSSTAYSLQGGPKFRDDNAWNASLGLNYQIARWGSIGLNYTYEDRSSDLVAFDYARTTVGIKLSGRW